MSAAPSASRIRILVTGANSFSARFLLPALAARDDVAAIAATGLQPQGPAGTEYAVAQIQDARAMRAVVAGARPDVVFHLAGIASNDADLCFAVNVDGTRHLIDACAAHGAATRVLLVSSAAVYGLTRDDESPVSERTPPRPITPYGVSKAAAELYALGAHRRRAVRAAVVRPFNLVGPGLRAGMAPSDFVAQAAAIRDGRASPELHVGNLEPRRDFLDVRDAVDAYQRLAFRDDVWGDTFNVASGVPVAVGDLLRTILRLAGVEARIVPDLARQRAVEVVEQVGDSAKLRSLLGWTPRYDLERSLSEMVSGSSG
jgi:GDP-4-dehydro-6-deoxy-D-mannose reductase